VRLLRNFEVAVEVEHVRYLGDVKALAIGLVFYVYWIASWSGDPGSHTYEDGAPFGELRWLPLDEVTRVNGYDSTAEMTKMLREALSSSHDASGRASSSSLPSN